MLHYVLIYYNCFSFGLWGKDRFLCNLRYILKKIIALVLELYDELIPYTLKVMIIVK